MPSGLPEEQRPNLSAYFARIGYGGPRTPTLETLAALVQSQAATIPYDTLDVFFGATIDLKPDVVERRLVQVRRGGNCYELNGLLRRMLLALGYDVTSLIARNMIGRPQEGLVWPRCHQVLKVACEGEDWLVDPGNGPYSPTAPLRWIYDLDQETPHGAFRLIKAGSDTLLEQAMPTGWRPVTAVCPEPQMEEDFIPANWWFCNHPETWVRHNLACSMSPETVRISLLNSRLTVRRLGGEEEQMFLDVDGLERCLREVFGLPVHPTWRPHLKRAVALDAAGG